MTTREVVVRAGWQDACILIFLQLQDEVLSRHLLEVAVVKATHQAVIVLVLDMLDDEVCGAEGFLADNTDILSTFVDQTCLLHAVLILLLDKDLVLLRVGWLLTRALL